MFKVKCDEIGVKDTLVQGPTTEIALAEKTSVIIIQKMSFCTTYC